MVQYEITDDDNSNREFRRVRSCLWDSNESPKYAVICGVCNVRVIERNVNGIKYFCPSCGFLFKKSTNQILWKADEIPKEEVKVKE